MDKLCGEKQLENSTSQRIRLMIRCRHFVINTCHIKTFDLIGTVRVICDNICDVRGRIANINTTPTA